MRSELDIGATVHSISHACPDCGVVVCAAGRRLQAVRVIERSAQLLLMGIASLPDWALAVHLVGDGMDPSSSHLCQTHQVVVAVAHNSALRFVLDQGGQFHLGARAPSVPSVVMYCCCSYMDGQGEEARHAFIYGGVDGSLRSWATTVSGFGEESVKSGPVCSGHKGAAFCVDEVVTQRPERHVWTACAADDRSVRIWLDAKERHTLWMPNGRPWCVQWARGCGVPEAQTIVAGGEDGTLRWFVDARQEAGNLPWSATHYACHGGVRCLAENEGWVVAGGDDGTVSFWNTRRALGVGSKALSYSVPLQPGDSVRCIESSGTTICVATGMFLFVRSIQGTWVKLDGVSGDDAKSPIQQVCRSSLGKWIPCRKNGSVLFGDSIVRRPLSSIQLAKVEGEYIVLATWNGSFVVCSTESGECVLQGAFTLLRKESITACTLGVGAGSGMIVALGTSDGSICVAWGERNLNSSVVLNRFPRVHTTTVTDLCFRSTACLLSSCRDGTIGEFLVELTGSLQTCSIGRPRCVPSVESVESFTCWQGHVVAQIQVSDGAYFCEFPADTAESILGFMPDLQPRTLVATALNPHGCFCACMISRGSVIVEQQWQFANRVCSLLQQGAHSAIVNVTRSSVAARSFVTAGDDGRWALWAESLDVPLFWRKSGNALRALTWSGDGETILLASATDVYRYSKNGMCLGTLAIRENDDLVCRSMWCLLEGERAWVGDSSGSLIEIRVGGRANSLHMVKQTKVSQFCLSDAVLQNGGQFLWMVSTRGELIRFSTTDGVFKSRRISQSSLGCLACFGSRMALAGDDGHKVYCFDGESFDNDVSAGYVVPVDHFSTITALLLLPTGNDSVVLAVLSKDESMSLWMWGDKGQLTHFGKHGVNVLNPNSMSALLIDQEHCLYRFCVVGGSGVSTLDIALK